MCGPKSKRSGFTIIEVLVVIVIIGILATITSVIYGGIQKRAISVSLLSDLRNASEQLDIYQIKNGEHYPTNIQDANLESSSDNVYDLYNQNGTSYCLQASNNRLVYHIESDVNRPETGKCPSYTFTMTFDRDDGYYASAITQTTDGGFAVTGGTDDPTSDMYTAKYSSTGVQEWLSTWQGSGNGDDRGRAIIQDGSNFVVVGETYNGNDFDIFTAMYNSSGVLLDDPVLTADPEFEDENTYPYSLIKTHDGYAITGRSLNDERYQAFFAKLDSTGSGVGWVYPHDDPDIDSYNTSIIETYENGTYYYVVAGSINTESIDSWNWFIGKYNASDGNQVWRDTDIDSVYGNIYTDGNNAYGELVTQINDGNYIFIGTKDSATAGNTDLVVFKFDKDVDSEGRAQLISHSSYGGINCDWVRDLIPTSSGGFAFAGVFGENEGGVFRDYLAYIAEGGSDGYILTWENHDAGVVFGADGSNAFGYSIYQKPDGSFRVIGESNYWDGGDDTYRPFYVEYPGSLNGGSEEPSGYGPLPEL